MASEHYKRRHQIAGLYDLEETIGEGHYAVVKMARHVFTGEKVAVKVIDKLKLDAATRVQMMQEVQLMKLVQHPHVVRLYEVIDTQTKLYLVLEFADGGDMYDYIMKHEGGLDEEQARRYFRQVVQAIQYCHKLHVVHRDLKPENVVFFEKLGIVKLTDFGFSNQFDPGQRLQTSCGSLAYSAPEILLGDEYDAPAVDIWSLGVILYMLVCGSAPFQEANDSETLTMIMDCKYSFPKHISQQCRDLISRMLQRNPDNRASLQDIVNDPWLGGAGDSEGNALSAAELLPLVSREHLSDEEHAQILSKMVAGKIAEKDEILTALDLNEYNHITATYFLLAERKLRAQRQALAHKLVKGQATEVEVEEKAIAEVSAAAVAAAAASDKDPSDFVGPIKVHHVRSNPGVLDRSATEGDTPFFRFPLPPSKPSSFMTSVLEKRSHLNPVLMTYSPGISRRPGSRSARSNVITEEFEGEIMEDSQHILDDDEEIIEDEVDSVAGLIVRGGSTTKARTLSRHSSTSSLIGSPPSSTTTLGSLALDISALAAGLKTALPGSGEGTPQEQQRDAHDAPFPFPVHSQIGTGSLSRQGSFRKAESVAGDSVSIEHKLGSSGNALGVPGGSPSSPSPSGSGSNVSSNQGSPARFRKVNKKLVSTRSSPQLVLNQIYEESEDGSQAGSVPKREEKKSPGMDPVDAFPTSAAGIEVIRRLEMRRRLHKARTQSCSSSDASEDDDSETRRKRHNKSVTPPLKREYHHDDSSDSQDPGVGASASKFGSSASGGLIVRNVQPKEGSNGQQKEQGHGQTRTNCSQRRSLRPHSSSSSSTNSSGHRRRLQSHHNNSTNRIRQSHSLNRISELHVVADFSNLSSDDMCSTNNNSSCPSSVASIVSGSTSLKQMTPPQLSFDDNDSDGAPFDMLTRYLESLTLNRIGSNKSRDDSQNSSDGELDTVCGSQQDSTSKHHRPSRRQKVNLRVLEQRLNKIQEENNRSADEEEGEVDDPDDGGELSDDPSTLPDELDSSEKKLTIELTENNNDNSALERNEDHDAGMEVYNPRNFVQDLPAFSLDKKNDTIRKSHETSSIRSCYLQNRSKQPISQKINPNNRRLHRAHSCGSLMSLKDLSRNIHPVLWDFLAGASSRVAPEEAIHKEKSGLTLGYSATNPLSTFFHIQETSRCCNLC